MCVCVCTYMYNLCIFEQESEFFQHVLNFGPLTALLVQINDNDNKLAFAVCLELLNNMKK